MNQLLQYCIFMNFTNNQTFKLFFSRQTKRAKNAFSGLNMDMYEHLFAACSSSNGCLGSVCVCQTDPVRHQGD